MSKRLWAASTPARTTPARCARRSCPTTCSPRRRRSAAAPPVRRGEGLSLPLEGYVWATTTSKEAAVAGTFDDAKGRAKEAIGDVTDDRDMQREGKVDR